jgi:hypothetical protein
MPISFVGDGKSGIVNLRCRGLHHFGRLGLAAAKHRPGTLDPCRIAALCVRLYG